jgi:hypothetical protein
LTLLSDPPSLNVTIPLILLVGTESLLAACLWTPIAGSIVALSETWKMLIIEQPGPHVKFGICDHKPSQRIDRARWPETRNLGALVAWFAHSHSARQFLRHLPSHWNSAILPPHCGQTKLMIEEMIWAFDSPGNMLTFLIIALLPTDPGKSARGRSGPQ